MTSSPVCAGSWARARSGTPARSTRWLRRARARHRAGHDPRPPALDTKAYLATIVLGASTTTDDAEGEVLSTADASRRHRRGDRGRDRQAHRPHPAGAERGQRREGLRQAGVRAGPRWGRGGAPARPVVVPRFDLLFARARRTVEFNVMVECCSGTYVRALARDLGADLGVGGHLGALRRTRVGPFDLRVATTLEKLAEQPALSLRWLTAVAAAFPAATCRTGRRVTAAQANGSPRGASRARTGSSTRTAERSRWRLTRARPPAR